eukprot:g1195.t1
MGFDTQYLKSTIGVILANALSEVLITNPNDPVQFLGQWLLKYVEKHEKTDEVIAQSKQFFMQQRMNEKSSNAEVKKIDTEEDLCKKLSTLDDDLAVSDVYELWESLLKNVRHFTEIETLRIAVVLPEPKQLEKETEESKNDDASLFSGILFEQNGEKGKAEEEKEEADNEQQKNYIEFLPIQGASRGLPSLTVYRPVTQSTDDDDNSEMSQLPSIFLLLDEGISKHYVKSCVQDPGMEFLLPVPKIGSCFMCTLSGQETGACEAVLICDTLCPPGNGAPIKETDRELICKLAKQTSELMINLEKDKPAFTGLCMDTLITLKSNIDSLDNVSETENEEVDSGKEKDNDDPSPTGAEDNEEVQILKEEIKSVTKELEGTKANLIRHEQLLAKEKKIMEAIQEWKEDKEKRSWCEIRCVVFESLIDDIVNYSLEQELEAWIKETIEELISASKRQNSYTISEKTEANDILGCLLSIFYKQVINF